MFAFREEDAQFFFGREVFAEQLMAAVQRQSFVTVIGASGSGKSSVVFAGLIPQLRAQRGWIVAIFRPGEKPFRNLAARLVPLLDTEMSETDQLVEVNKLAKAFQNCTLALEDVVQRILEKQSAERFLLVADQFEELYTLCQDETISPQSLLIQRGKNPLRKREGFLDCLLSVLQQTSNVALVLTLRADFLSYALSYRPFADALQDADVKLGPMNEEELREAIEKPAELLGVRLEAGLTARILEDVEKSPGNLPLLEFALEQLWRQQNNGQLTHAAYQNIGGVEKALAEYAEEVYEQLNEVDKQRAQRVLLQLMRPGEGTEDTRRLATRTDTKSAIARPHIILDRFYTFDCVHSLIAGL